jgi:hypothetical protein
LISSAIPRSSEFEEVTRCYSASCVFADAQYRTGVMHSSIKAAFPPKAVELFCCFTPAIAMGVKMMMGERQVDESALFYEFSFEKHVPAGHMLALLSPPQRETVMI